jgi:hypothetical protein
MKTLNTGMITVINHNTRTSSLMTELTFAHEVGHNLGAEVRILYHILREISLIKIVYIYVFI